NSVDRSLCGRHASDRAPAKHVAPSAAKHAAPAFPVVSFASPTAPAPSVPTSDYVVVSGDTLSQIASVHGVSGGWQQLYDDNRDTIANPNVITIGQRLRVRGGVPGEVNAPAVRPPGSAATPAVPAQISPGVAARAVGAALAQLGTPYVYGGSAPGGFDCSGLVKWTYQKAGLTLPRTAAAQATAGRPVSVSNLQPGDLLFFYRPVSHVVIYVGDGKIAEASQPGTPVHVRSMYLHGLVGARRVV
ncbi:MAG: NlpC/P60 family protein, partial [Pseudonocardiaceae bacterium]